MKVIEFFLLKIIIIQLFSQKNCLFTTYFEELIYSNTRQCHNHGRSYLDKIYSEYLDQYREYEEIQLRRSLPDFNNDFQDHEFDRKNLFENSQCNEHKRNRTLINQQSLCPWKLTVIYRKEKYPHYKSMVKCTCETCTSKSNFFFECIPVFKTVPVLERTNCRTDGFFEWKRAKEKISVACVCAFRHKFLPHRS